MSIKIALRALLAFAGSTCAHAAPPSATQGAAVSQAMLDAVRELSGVPGMSAAVWRDDRVIWTGVSGWRDMERNRPVTRDTRFRLASVSKLVTVTAAAKLAEESRLDLDAPVAAILPWLDNNWPTITARQLAAHTSGLPHYQAADANRGSANYPTGRDAVNLFANRALLSNPGERYSYSSWGYTLLGALVEQAGGQPFTDYVARHVTPDVIADATDSGDEHASKAYDFADRAVQAAPPHDFSYTWGGGGLMASAEGIVRFGGAMLANRIVSADTFDAMTRPYTLASGRPAGEEDYTVGFGWRSALGSDGKPVTFHNGATLGARSSLVLWRDEGIAASILSNASWTSSIDSTSQMLAAPFRPVPGGMTEAACPVGTGQFEGTLADSAVAGDAEFHVADGICQGVLQLSGDLLAYFDRGPQPTARQLRVVGIDARGGLSRAGLITPYGIYDLRADGDGQFRTRLSAKSALMIRVSPQRAKD